MTKFSIVSARLEVELLTAYQQLREAFSKDEVNNARDKKDTLEDFSSVREEPQVIEGSFQSFVNSRPF